MSKPSLPMDYQPGPWAVICGKGKQCFNHVGNKRFRYLCEMHQTKYENARNRTEKSIIVMSIVDSVRKANPVGGFVRFDNKIKRWTEVGDAAAREKVGQQFRENMVKKNHEKSHLKRLQRREQRFQRTLRRNASEDSNASQAREGSQKDKSTVRSPGEISADLSSNQDNGWRRRAADFFHNVDFFHGEGESSCSDFSLSGSEGEQDPRHTELLRQDSPTGVLDPFPFVDPFEVLPPPQGMELEVPPQPKLVRHDSKPLALDSFLDDPLAAPPLLSSESLTLIINRL